MQKSFDSNTVMSRYKDHLKLRPPSLSRDHLFQYQNALRALSLLKLLVSVPKCIFQCKICLTEMRPVHAKLRPLSRRTIGGLIIGMSL